METKMPVVKQVSNNSHILYYDQRISSGWNRDMLLMSDVHIDSLKCDKQKLKRHLVQAQEKDALVFIFGDLFDIMQGTKDRRGNKHSLDLNILKRMQEEDKEYYDVACEEAIDFFKPFKDNMFFASYGNHETAINRHNEFDVLRRFTNELDMHLGGYEGYIKFSFGDNKQGALKQVLKYHHGYGGAKRSKGMLDSQLFAYVYPDADICVRGHNHYKFLDTNVRERLSDHGVIRDSKQYYVNLGTYKEKEHSMGWETEKGFFPTATGGWWLNFSLVYENDGQRGKARIKSTFYEAD